MFNYDRDNNTLRCDTQLIEAIKSLSNLIVIVLSQLTLITQSGFYMYAIIGLEFPPMDVTHEMSVTATAATPTCG